MKELASTLIRKDLFPIPTVWGHAIKLGEKENVKSSRLSAICISLSQHIQKLASGRTFAVFYEE